MKATSRKISQLGCSQRHLGPKRPQRLPSYVCYADLPVGRGLIDQDLCIQLATAKLPKCVTAKLSHLAQSGSCNKDAFVEGMYQWASTMTSSGQNLPFTLPLQTDKTANGFDIAFLRFVQGEISRTARICCVVENVPEGQVFFARFYAAEDPFPDGNIPPGNDEQRLNTLLDSLPDVPLIMQTMQPALKKIVVASC